MANWNTIPGNQIVAVGETVRRKLDDSGWEGHAWASTKADVGLGNVDNTSDASKPISTATQTALDAKQDLITSGTTAQYMRGDLSLATFPTIPAAQVNCDWTSVSGVSQVLNKPTLATVATTGSYTDLSNKPTIPTLPSYGQSAVTRSFNTVFVPSSTRNVVVSYSVEIAATISLTAGQTGTVFLEISADGSTGWTEISRATNGNTGTLTIGLNLTQTATNPVVGTVPAGYSVRLRTTGTATITYRAGQETLI